MLRHLVCALALVIAPVSVAQRSSQTTLEPESGFLSSTRYVNAYFGFLLPIPQNSGLRSFYIPSTGAAHFLYGIRTQAGEQSVLSVVAQPSRGDPKSDAKESARTAKKSSIKKVMIGGKEFWRGQFTSESPAGRVESLTYTIPMRGFVLAFNVLAFDSSLAQAFEQSIESVRFFNPEQAAESAGQDSHRWNPAHPDDPSATPHSDRIAQVTPGKTSSGFYENDDLGIAWMLPKEWIVNPQGTRTSTADGDDRPGPGDDAQASREQLVAAHCSRRLLLAMPPAADGPAMAAFFAADPTCWPDIRFPASGDLLSFQQIFPFLHAVTTVPAKGAAYSLWKEPVSGHLLYIVDWTREAGTAGGKEKRVYGSVTLAESNGYWLVWEFLSPTTDGLQQLKRTEIAFAGATTHAPAK